MVMVRSSSRVPQIAAAVALAIGLGGCSLIPTQTVQHALGDAAATLAGESAAPEASESDAQVNNEGDAEATPAQPEIPAASPGTSRPALSPMPAGTALDISAQEPKPGEYFDFQMCTAAWSFSLEDGRNFAVTASHCGKPGDRVWAGNAHRTFTFPAEPIGEVVYSDLYSDTTHGLDFALIELHADVGYYTPKYMEAGVATTGELPQQLCKLGRITGETCGELSHGPEKGGLKSGEIRMETTAARARLCGTQGDSGGPMYAQLPGGPAIVGVVSGTTQELKGQCAEASDMELSFTPAADIVALIPEILGSEIAQAA